MMYDDHGSFNNTCRYVLEPDTDEVEKILTSHIPEEQKTQNQYSMDIEPGYIVTTGPVNKLHLSEGVDSV